MPELSREKIEQALGDVADPHLGLDLVAAKAVRDIRIEGESVTVDLVMPYPCARWGDTLATLTRQALASQAGVTDAIVNVSHQVIAHSVQQGVKRLENVKNIVAIASGKGGVGKSTTAANLALALAAEGATVGLLDADIYGPSQPRMMGLSGQPESTDGKSLEPKENYGIQTMSIGYLIDEETPMIWRGPMVTQALEQLLNDTRWRDLDYLLIDLPPGTGDTQLTLAQKVPLSGAIIITTPQDIALLDARKGLKMFEKVDVPILGIVENMSTHICSNCGHEEHVFGAGGGQRMADEAGVNLLGSLPLELRIREHADAGRPTVVAEPDSAIAEAYREIARKAAAKLSRQAKDYSSRFPNIVIQNT